MTITTTTTRKTLGLIKKWFNSLVNSKVKPTLTNEDMDGTFDSLATPTAPSNRIEAGVARHTWYDKRFPSHKQIS